MLCSAMSTSQCCMIPSIICSSLESITFTPQILGAMESGNSMTLWRETQVHQTPCYPLYLHGYDDCNLLILYSRHLSLDRLSFTGFYAAVSNPKTIRTWDLTYRACSRAPLYDDQTMFWLILRTNQNPPAAPLVSCPTTVERKTFPIEVSTSKEIVSCPLDSCMFSAGNLREGFVRPLANSLKAKNQKAVAAHANWMNGKDKKKSALANAGLWIARRPPKGPDDRGRRGSGNWSCASPKGFLVF